MVLSFIRGESGLGDFDRVVNRSIEMLGDARQSFELATRALLIDGPADDIGSEIRETDRRINRTEQALRAELIDHVTRRGAAEIHSVFGLVLLIKKIERCGDFAKDILELTESGVSLAPVPEAEMLLSEREVVSDLFVRAAELLTVADPDLEAVEDFVERVDCVSADCQARIDSYLTSNRSGDEVVPLAIYSRFQRRIVANLKGLVLAWADPEYLTDGGYDAES